MSNITQKDSLLLQILSNTVLLAELSNADFLKSDYFQKLQFSNKNCKEILFFSGIGNPATMQMMLYALLVIPKEFLSQSNDTKLEEYITDINSFVYKKIEQGAESTYSTYSGEENVMNINFVKHIRNAVAHSRCKYSSENYTNYVVFTDTDNKFHECNIKMKTQNVGLLLGKLQQIIMEYISNKHP